MTTKTRKVTDRRRHLRQTKSKGVVPVRRHDMHYWGRIVKRPNNTYSVTDTGGKDVTGIKTRYDARRIQKSLFLMQDDRKSPSANEYNATKELDITSSRPKGKQETDAYIEKKSEDFINSWNRSDGGGDQDLYDSVVSLTKKLGYNVSKVKKKLDDVDPATEYISSDRISNIIKSSRPDNPSGQDNSKNTKSKFKEGDWISDDKGRTGEVNSVHPDGRMLVTWDGSPPRKHDIVLPEDNIKLDPKPQ